ncbi:hypothetical protein FPOA_13502 [Fusarium poae]|uniref:Uncharacterized protein n=1 Tax=Fusarium poae TaxID=36050 RepID=A0A1B8A5H7_FUSPO|nr:hypothetical protein FPOA_13502 [Fusarium poae]
MMPHRAPMTRRFLTFSHCPINSLDTTSPPPSTTWQVIARIQALRNNSNKAVIRAVSPSPKQQQQQSIPSPHRIITEIKALIVQEGISITDQLSGAEEKSHQLAEDEERLGSELKNAEEELDTAISNEKAFLFKIFEGQLGNAFEEASKKATESMNTWLAGWGKQARKEGNTPLANDARNTHVEKVRSRKNGVQVDQIHSLIQGAIQAELDDSVKGTVEDQKKALRPFSEKVESAQTNVDGLEKQVKDVKAEKARMHSLELFYRGLSGL